MAEQNETRPVRGTRAPGFYRFTAGEFDAVALHDGVLVRDRPAGFVTNADSAEVGEAFAALGMPRDKLTITFGPLAVETGDGVVLIDTGFGDSGPPGTGLAHANMQAAGIAPDAVRSVIITHFHGDHILGLQRGGAPAFPNAQVFVPKPEWEFWTDEARASAAPEGMKDSFDTVRKIFGPIAQQVRPFDYGQEILPGFAAVDASGHTPGMAAIAIAGGSVTYVADITNNPLLFARHPDWQVAFDMDGPKSVETRKRMLDRAASEHQRLFFFHAPFPGLGFILKSGSGYEYVPALWQG